MLNPPRRPRAGAWVTLAAIAALWPARLAGPLDGIPLDAPLEAAIIGVVLVWLLLCVPRAFAERLPRLLIITLLVWKGLTSALLVQDGWCLRFTLPVPVFVDNVTVPHSWDLRADWRSPVPRCTAIMTHGYPELERFPAWFYNLAPANWESPVHPGDRPPGATSVLDLDGFIDTSQGGTLVVQSGEDVAASATIAGRTVSKVDLEAGVPIDAGQQRINIHADLRRTHWSLSPLWNGSNLWSAATATVDPPSALDRAMRPWGRYVPALLIGALLLLAFGEIVRAVERPVVLASVTGLASIVAALAWSGRDSLRRVVPLLLIGAAVLPWPRRVRNTFAWSTAIAAPFLVLFIVMGAGQAGLFTWYSSGDDWWMFQRFAYRIYMQGHWIEGGQPTFWFQPLYRWVAGALHMIFGDSSVGELFWDAGAALMGANFAFLITHRVAGFRWAVAASTIVLAVFTLGPAWYLFGRGLSEFTSAGFIYAAALVALRGRHNRWPLIVAAGILATLGFYTRLNNLPMAAAVAAFALPVDQPIGTWFTPRAWWPRLSKPVVAGIIGSLSLGIWLFTARTYYFTGFIDMFHGTSANLNAVWHPEESLASNAARYLSSLLMLLTVNDPPRFDVRAIPVFAGFIAAVLGVCGVRPFTRLPMNAALLCVATAAGAFVARGVAYPGRFSVHMIPVAVTMFVCTLWLFVTPERRSRQSAVESQARSTPAG